ncbi:MAG: hypothetical protein J6Q74_02060 [Clostridia bacterium]|nr:hypothetical protein [Clostridia bacterium]
MEQSLIASRIDDACKICNNSSFPKFVGFLRAEETAIAESVAQKLCCRHLFYGGYSNAERVFFGVFPDWCEEPSQIFPITAFTFTFRPVDKLTHREVLGSLMSLGIKRETVGDILIEEGRAVVFVTSEVAPFIKSQLTKISRVGVDISEGYVGNLPGQSGFLDLSHTVASARLDCVVAALAGVSRKTATEYIEQKLVTLGSVCCEKTTLMVQNGDKISIRSKGKFLIEKIDEKTRKGRLIIKAKKYI